MCMLVGAYTIDDYLDVQGDGNFIAKFVNVRRNAER
jgi:hypothetical protein